MGISIGHNWSCSDYDIKAQQASFERTTEKPVPKPLPNPNPKRFTILNWHQNGKYLVVLVYYPDCTNYEGQKILLYSNTWIEDLVGQGSIDPHFSNNPDYKSPIARFVPTLEGWNMAVKLIDVLRQKEMLFGNDELSNNRKNSRHSKASKRRSNSS